jgi:hypothetical protein
MGFTFRLARRSLPTMSTAGEIEAAIRTLSPTERKKLVRDLPALLPELDGDEAWKRIIEDPTPNAALSAHIDAIDAEYQRNPDAFPEINNSDFDTRS